jgi:hypothetical protein
MIEAQFESLCQLPSKCDLSKQSLVVELMTDPIMILFYPFSNDSMDLGHAFNGVVSPKTIIIRRVTCVRRKR